MKLMRLKKLIVGVAVLAAPVFAMAQSAQQLIEKYTPLAGNCEANAASLVSGLRDGTRVTLRVTCPSTSTGSTAVSRLRLVIPPSPVAFDPPTEKMGFGNVDNALTLAQGSLASLNIVAVSAANLRAVLMGGQDFPVMTPGTPGGKLIVPGILTLRSQGLGWGEIAKEVGAKL